MKNITIILIVLCAVSSAFSQKKIELGGQLHNQKVMLKWAPANYEVLDLGFQNSYTITRFPIEIQGVTYSLSDSRDSAVILSSNVNVVDSTDLVNHNTNATLFAKAMIYDSTMQVNDSLHTANFAKAFQQNAEKENRHLFYVAMSDQDFISAKLMGLAFEDDTYLANSKYRYNVCIEYDTFSVCSNLIEINTSESINTLSPPFDLEGYGKDSLAVLQWKTEDGQYTFYDIERSSDGITFAKVNSEPFMFMGMSAEDDVMTYQDHMPQNHVDYHYRIVGLSPFGFNGPFSDTIVVKGIPDKLLLELRIDSIDKNEATREVSLDWRLISQTPQGVVESYIDHFNIIYQKRLDDTISLVNTAPIANSQRDFTFTAPTTAGYYSLEMIDVNSRQYLSIPHLIQFNDSIPPAIPTGLDGFMDDKGNIQLTWDANLEEDLDGYFVYFSYSRDSDFQIMSTEMLKDNKYTVYKDPSIHTDSLYFVVTALDNRFNESDYSVVLDLKKPDINPPSQPILTIVNPGEGGVRIGWRESKDTDIRFFYLTRKLHIESQWDTLLRWLPGTNFQPYEDVFAEKHPVYYIDTTELLLMKYDYRITAEDEVGLLGHSKVKTIIPYDDGIRGQIDSPKAYGSACNVPAGLNSNGSNGLANGLPSGSNNKPMAYPCTLLSWDYSTGYQSTLIAFKIYRVNLNDPSGMIPTPNGPQEAFRLIKTVRLPEAEETAINFPTNAPYAFLDENGTKPTKDPIKYMIIAEHKDGGMSEWSVEIEVQ